MLSNCYETKYISCLQTGLSVLESRLAAMHADALKVLLLSDVTSWRSNRRLDYTKNISDLIKAKLVLRVWKVEVVRDLL